MKITPAELADIIRYTQPTAEELHRRSQQTRRIELWRNGSPAGQQWELLPGASTYRLIPDTLLNVTYSDLIELKIR